MPVTTVVAKRADAGFNPSEAVERHSGAANLIGGWAIMWPIMTAFPKLHHVAVEAATHFVNAPLSTESVALALLGGMVITPMTRMLAWDQIRVFVHAPSPASTSP